MNEPTHAEEHAEDSPELQKEDNTTSGTQELVYSGNYAFDAKTSKTVDTLLINISKAAKRAIVPNKEIEELFDFLMAGYQLEDEFKDDVLTNISERIKSLPYDIHPIELTKFVISLIIFETF